MGTDQFVFFRTDGNTQIASGHLMRCISIADACRKLGMEIHFLVSDEESVSLFQQKLSADFPITRLKSASYDQLEQELPELLSLLANCKPSKTIFFLDSYYVTEKYLNAVRKLAKTVYIDDLMLFNYPVNLLINYDVIPPCNMPSYQSAYTNAAKALLGASYAPLREQFQSREMPLRNQVCNVLITTGGSDPFHFCLNFLSFIERVASLPNSDSARIPDDIIFHILVGSFNTDKDALFSFAQASDFIRLYENVTDMASLMENCDLAVSAAGTTLYELCALGVPTISYTMADNQITAAEAFAKSGIIPYSGDIRVSMTNVLENIMLFLTQMSNSRNSDLASATTVSYQERKIAHDTMRSFIDGSGSAKIAKAILDL